MNVAAAVEVANRLSSGHLEESLEKGLGEELLALAAQLQPTASGYQIFLASLFGSEGLLIAAQDSKSSDVLVTLAAETFTQVIRGIGSSLGLLESYAQSLVQLGAVVVQSGARAAKAREAGILLLVAAVDELRSLGPDRLFVAQLITILHNLSAAAAWKKLGVGLKRGVLILLGALARHFYRELRGEPTRVRRFGGLVLGELREQMESNIKAPVLAIIDGSFQALDGLLFHNSDAMEEWNARVNKDKVFVYLCNTLNPNKGSQSRLGPQKAALRLLMNHLSLFSLQLLPSPSFSFQDLHQWLSFWATKADIELRNPAMRLSDILLEHLSSSTIPELERAGRSEEMRAATTGFVDDFRRRLAEGVEPREVGRAAKGLGLFAAAFGRLYGAERLRSEVLGGVLERVWQLYSLVPGDTGASDVSDENANHLLTFAEAIAALIPHIDQGTLELVELERLEWFLIVFLSTWPVYGRNYLIPVRVTAQRLFLSLSAGGHASLVARVLKAVLVAACARPPLAPSEEVPWEGQRSRDFAGLFVALTSEGGRKSPRGGNLVGPDAAALAESVFGDVVASLLHVLPSLNLATRLRNQDGEVEESREIDETSEAVNLSDFWLLINLCELCKEWLPTTKPEFMNAWTEMVVESLIQQSRRYPAVSGFYKLLGVFIAQSVKAGDLPEPTAHKLAHFVDEVLGQVGDMKEDLLISCLGFLLAVPVAILQTSPLLLSAAVTKALEQGLSLVSLGEATLDALELWEGQMGREDFVRLLLPCAPVFDAYLRSHSVSADDQSEAQGETVSMNRRRAQWRRQRHGQRRVARGDSGADDVDRFLKLRTRILNLIIPFPQLLRELVLGGDRGELIAATAVKWDSRNHLEIPIPFPDCKPIIHLDGLLPHVSELALRSGNRETKVAACELLHSLVLVLLGNHANRSKVQAESAPMDALYARLFPQLLGLCVDSDSLPRQLFRPLFSQIIHWFSGNKNEDNAETAALVEALWDAVADEHDATLRHFAGERLGELLEWSCRQGSPDDGNPRRIFERLLSLARHPGGAKRRAAALAFNSLYRHFRENEKLVSRYGLELLFEFMESLDMSETRSKTSSQASKQSQTAVKHLNRILSLPRYAAVLRNAKREARVPRGWTDNTFSSAIRWLCSQLPRRSRAFRFSLFFLLSPKEGLVREAVLKAAGAPSPAVVLKDVALDELMPAGPSEGDELVWVEVVVGNARRLLGAPFRFPLSPVLHFLGRIQDPVQRTIEHCRAADSEDVGAERVSLELFALSRALVNGQKMDSKQWASIQDSLLTPGFYSLLLKAAL